MIDAHLEWFSINSARFSGSDALRLDATFYNQDYLRSLDLLDESGMDIRTLGDITDRVFMPGSFQKNLCRSSLRRAILARISCSSTPTN